eukprot:766538-Hanusia_phi.AAC.2
MSTPDEISEKLDRMSEDQVSRKDKRKIGLGCNAEVQNTVTESASNVRSVAAENCVSNGSDKRRRVTISKEVLVCYFQDDTGQDEIITFGSRSAADDVDFETEETKNNDGPSAEALILDELVTAMILKNDSNAICPVLKRMILKGSKDTFSKVRERIAFTINRIKESGKVSLLPSNTLLGPASIQILQFLDESVKRSVSLIDSFAKDRQESMQVSTVRPLHENSGTKV